jgi:hypothetical protein
MPTKKVKVDRKKSKTGLPPIILMAHGFACERTFRLPGNINMLFILLIFLWFVIKYILCFCVAYAERLVSSLNVAVFLFDCKSNIVFNIVFFAYAFKYTQKIEIWVIRMVCREAG